MMKKLQRELLKKLFLAMMVLVSLCITPAFAVKVASLYQVEIPVASQAADARAQAIQDGFLRVLIKVSGDPHVDQNPDVRASLKSADYYVQEYSYLLPSTSSSEYILLIRYNKRDVNTLLKRSGVAYWGENRPLILVWLAVSNGQEPTEIVDNDTPNGVLNVMKQQGKKYGLPLIFPMMDVSDVNQVTPADVSAMTLPVLKEAGKRYSPDALLIGNLKQGDGGCESTWQLVLGGTQWNWKVTGKSPDEVVNNVLNLVSQTFVKRYVVKAANGTRSWFKLEVSNITERNDLVQLIQYLKQLSPVQQVQLSQVSGNMVELAVQVRGSLTTFQQNASIGQRMVLKSQDQTNNKLIYEWTH